jgi:glutathione S-transferase
MVNLHHHPFCPHSRFVRLALAEYKVPFELIDEDVRKRRPEFLELNPAGTTPVLVDGNFPVSTASIIAEYIDETHASNLGGHRLLPAEPKSRAEARRIAGWFHEKFFTEVSEPLVREKILKLRLSSAEGGGSPDSAVLQAAKKNIRYHLQYIGWLLKARSWLATEKLTFADLAAAAHLSVVDYLGDVPWDEDENAKNWYAKMKSRPSFRPLLADIVPGLPPSKTYADLDF